MDSFHFAAPSFCPDNCCRDQPIYHAGYLLWACFFEPCIRFSAHVRKSASEVICEFPCFMVSWINVGSDWKYALDSIFAKKLFSGMFFTSGYSFCSEMKISTGKQYFFGISLHRLKKRACCNWQHALKNIFQYNLQAKKRKRKLCRTAELS